MLYLEEQPLDLSLKSRDGSEGSELNSSTSSDDLSFDFNQFYRNYLAISVRSWSVYQSQIQFIPTATPYSRLQLTTNSVKRKLSDEFDQISVSNKKGRIEKTHESRINKSLRRKKKEEISMIQNSCDCKQCYEAHINKLRVKSDVAWKMS